MSEIQMLKRRCDRERKARLSAEAILEEKSREVYRTNLELIRVASDLRKQIEKTQAILDYAGEGIVTIGEGNRIHSFNPAAQRIFGMTFEEARGRPFESLVPELPAAVIAALASQQTFGPDELRHTRSDGESLVIELTISSVANIDEKLMIALIRNRTSRKQLETQLALAQKMESVGQLAAGIAHEINTPIQFVGDNICFLRDSFETLDSLVNTYDKLLDYPEHVSGQTGVLGELMQQRQDADLDFIREEVPDAIEQTRNGIERVASIVRAMKEFSHPGAVEANILDVNKALQSTITVSRNEWKYVSTLETDFEQNLPAILGYPGDLNQAFLNIIVNAAHAIERKGDYRSQLGRIRVSTRKIGDGVEILVSDNGCGIQSSHLDKIFDPFFTTKSIGKGTGQGLSIVHAVIVEKHRGSIHVESEPGAGTTFLIQLPVDHSITQE